VFILYRDMMIPWKEGGRGEGEERKGYIYIYNLQGCPPPVCGCCFYVHMTHTSARAQTRMHPGTRGPDHARTHAPAHEHACMRTYTCKHTRTCIHAHAHALRTCTQAHACMRPHNAHACIRTRTREHTCTCARTRANTCPHIFAAR